MKHRTILFTMLSFLMLGLLITSCSKDDDDEDTFEAVFSYTGNNRPAPAKVIFTNETVGATSYSWDFGDGETSTEASPTHTYAEKGAYVVKMTATAEDGTTSTQKSFIDILGDVKGVDIDEIIFEKEAFGASVPADPDDGGAPDITFVVEDASGNIVINPGYSFADCFDSDTQNKLNFLNKGKGTWQTLDLNGTYTIKIYDVDLDANDGSATDLGLEFTFSVADIVPSNDTDPYPYAYFMSNNDVMIDLDWVDE